MINAQGARKTEKQEIRNWRNLIILLIVLSIVSIHGFWKTINGFGLSPTTSIANSRLLNRPECMKSRHGPLCWIGLPFLKREGMLFSCSTFCIPQNVKSIEIEKKSISWMQKDDAIMSTLFIIVWQDRHQDDWEWTAD